MMKSLLIAIISILLISAAPKTIDLSPMLQKAVIVANSGNQYKLDTQALLTKQIDIHGNGALIIAPGQHDCFTLLANEVEIDNWVCNKANIFAHVQADDCSLSKCTLRNIVNAVKVEYGAQRFKASEVNAESSSVTFYSEGSMQLDRCKGKSIGEYAVRSSWSGKGKPSDTQILIIGGEYTNEGNAFGKDTIGVRCGFGRITGTIVHGNIRIGQDKQPDDIAVGYWSILEIDHCTFDQQSPGHNYIEVKQGVILYEHDNTFAPAKNPPFGVTPAPGAKLVHGKPPEPTILPIPTTLPTTHQ